jgi:hypothetical protein
MFIHKILFLHKWDMFQTVDVYGKDEYGRVTEMPIYKKYHLQCEICGSIKITKG